jgi:hypothetical protein
MRGGQDMTSKSLLRFAGMVAAAAALIGVSAASAAAQEYPGSTVTVGGGASPVNVGDVVIRAPGVTIDGGDVTNETGIGVLIGGGNSIGSVPGGGTNASIVE